MLICLHPCPAPPPACPVLFWFHFTDSALISVADDFHIAKIQW